VSCLDLLFVKFQDMMSLYAQVASVECLMVCECGPGSRNSASCRPDDAVN